MDIVNIYKESRKVEIQEFGSFFNSCKEEAFRLELLQEFHVEQERKVLKDFFSGKEKPTNFNSDWHQILKNANNRNCCFKRVRYIQEPLTGYLDFEINWGYKGNVKNGEQIFITNENPKDMSQSIPILKDFWLFDNQHLFFIEYDFIGQFLGVTKLENTYLDKYLSFKENILKNSIIIEKSKYW
ncbi:hypothetical protein EZY14_004190 [Kordia sp. TARA_039_SRF]|nr:hypothetical protein EZY14_004190 [Kordia sp. TARA_039_SRF]